MSTLLHPARTTPVLGDLALLVARVAIGFVLLAHGWQKYDEYTLAGTTAAFGDMGVPAPGAAALFSTFVEIAGGLALLVGILAPLAAAVNIVNLVGALVVVHAGNGVFVDDGGYELVLALVAGLVVVLASGAGRFSADGLLLARRRTAG